MDIFSRNLGCWARASLLGGRCQRAKRRTRVRLQSVNLSVLRHLEEKANDLTRPNTKLGTKGLPDHLQLLVSRPDNL